jgi:hypothetical protein
VPEVDLDRILVRESASFDAGGAIALLYLRLESDVEFLKRKTQNWAVSAVQGKHGVNSVLNCGG